MYVTHLYRGLSTSGRFAITACSEPKPFKKCANTTRYISDVSCKRCLNRIDANDIAQGDQEHLPGDETESNPQ